MYVYNTKCSRFKFGSTFHYCLLKFEISGHVQHGSNERHCLKANLNMYVTVLCVMIRYVDF